MGSAKNLRGFLQRLNVKESFSVAGSTGRDFPFAKNHATGEWLHKVRFVPPRLFARCGLAWEKARLGAPGWGVRSLAILNSLPIKSVFPPPASIPTPGYKVFIFGQNAYLNTSPSLASSFGAIRMVLTSIISRSGVAAWRSPALIHHLHPRLVYL